ncbi:hypothetical protein EV426DRAFT_539875 [Tirmania nivea]|nr:hypothetical protein EV426DRAFT_539875 [Tirmania nivea]
MVTRRKRPQSVHDEEPPHQKGNTPSIQQQLRDCWEFAALGQYLFIFGAALKIPDNWSIEALESELLGTAPDNFIPQIKMALLRSISSHKGLVDDQFDDYTRRQFLAKRPKANPFGDGEQPASFADLPVLTKVQVLHQLSQWSLIHADRLREKLGDITDKEQQEWRVEPCGFDSQDNIYFLLDDNRLYQRTPMKVPSTTKPQKLPKSVARPSKRRRLTNGQIGDDEQKIPEDDPDKVMLESMKWTCVCATIEEYQQFIEKWKKSKDQNERALRSYLIDDVLPVLHMAEEEKKREEAARQRQLAIEAAIANRKRSSRIDAKLARQREEEEKAEAERKRQEEIKAEKEAAERAERIGRERESRLAARERRIREREGRLSLARLEPNKESGNDSDSTAQGGRQSTRRRELEKKKLEEEQARASDEWMFDCICGIHGNNYDDGTPQVACDKCEVWQHVACLNLSPGTENKEFVCERCLYREEHPVSLPPAEGAQSPAAASISPKITIKLKLPTVHYEDSPIRVVPGSRTKPDILPLSPRRSPNTKVIQEQPSPNKLHAPSPNLTVSNGHPPLQRRAHDHPATDGVDRANGSTDAPRSQGAEGAPPANQATLPQIQAPQQACKAKDLGETGDRGGST